MIRTTTHTLGGFEMPSKLVRIVLDMTSNNFIVEYGERRRPGLKETEQEELSKLGQELHGFSDFTLAENLSDAERQEMMKKRKRFEELSMKETEEHFEWYPIEPHLIESLLVVVEPNMRHTYVENLPSNLISKIMDPQKIIVNVGKEEEYPENIPLEFSQVHADVSGLTEEKEIDDLEDSPLLSLTPKERKVIVIIAQDTPNWQDLVTIKEVAPGIVQIKPKSFLKDAWKPINRALREAFGDCWKSKGAGDKDAHWTCEL